MTCAIIEKMGEHLTRKEEEVESIREYLNSGHSYEVILDMFSTSLKAGLKQ